MSIEFIENQSLVGPNLSEVGIEVENLVVESQGCCEVAALFSLAGLLEKRNNFGLNLRSRILRERQ